MKNTCLYCKNLVANKKLSYEPEYDSAGVDLTIMYNKIHINAWFDLFCGIPTADIPINFCPMCGRKL